MHVSYKYTAREIYSTLRVGSRLSSHPRWTIFSLSGNPPWTYLGPTVASGSTVDTCSMHPARDICPPLGSVSTVSTVEAWIHRGLPGKSIDYTCSRRQARDWCPPLGSVSTVSTVEAWTHRGLTCKAIDSIPLSIYYVECINES